MTLRQSPSGPIDVSNAVPFAALAGLKGDRGSIVGARENLGLYQWIDSQNITPNGAQVVNAPGGQWQRLPQASLQWCSQAAWTIDPINGSDLAPSVIKSWAEFNARTQPQGTLRQNTTISILSDMSESINWNGFIGLYDPVNLDISSPSTSWAQTGGGTITTFTSLVPTTQQNAIVDDTGGAFTGKEGQRIRITSGASIGATAWILKVNSATQVELAGDFQQATTLADLGAIVTPLAGVTYVIETLPRVGSVSMQVQSPGAQKVAPPLFTQLTMRSLAIDKIGQVPQGRECTVTVQSQGGESQFRMLGCRYRGRRFSTQLGFGTMMGCFFQNDGLLTLDNVTLSGGGFLGSASGSLAMLGAVRLVGNFVVRNPSGAPSGLVSLDTGASLIIAGIGSIGCFDNPTGPGIAMGSFGLSSVIASSTSNSLRGNGNAGFGGVILSGRIIQYGTAKPIITGTLGDWQIGGATVAYAAIPFFDTAKACGLVTL